MAGWGIQFIKADFLPAEADSDNIKASERHPLVNMSLSQSIHTAYHQGESHPPTDTCLSIHRPTITRPLFLAKAVKSYGGAPYRRLSNDTHIRD